MLQVAETGVVLLCWSGFVYKHDEVISGVLLINVVTMLGVAETTFGCEQKHCLNILLL